jgi:hypothetical protein
MGVARDDEQMYITYDGINHAHTLMINDKYIN